MGVLLSWLLMVWLLSRFSPMGEFTAASLCYTIVILPYAFIVARLADKIVKRKRPWVFLLLVYLIFDLRPLLLVPNLILSRKPCVIYKQGSGSMQLSVFPRLCIAGDPIQTNQAPPEVTEAEIGKLIKCTYGAIDPTSKVFFVKTAVHMRDYQTDEYWHTLIAKWECQQTQGTNQTEIANLSRRRQYAESQLADKKLRDLRLRLIDYTLAHLPEEDRKNAEDGSNAVSRMVN
jgi:hypothetical protein